VPAAQLYLSEVLMAWTDADLATIRSHIATGVRRVVFADGRSTEYHSLDQMIAAEKVIAAQLQMTQRAASGLVRRRYGAFRSGV
jgi:hypothetical protein